MTDMIVSGAGTSDANGTYAYAGLNSGKPYYAKGENVLAWIDSLWVIFNVLETNARYESTEDVATPDLVATWTVGVDGTLPVPTVTAASSSQNLTLTCAAGSYSLTGTNVTLTHTPASQNLTLTHTPASQNLTLTCQAAGDTRLLLSGPNNNYGATTLIASGRFGTDYEIQRSLFKFDVSSIVGVATSVTFDLYIGDTTYSYANTIVDVYGISAANGDWVEGTKNAVTAGYGEPCWNKKAYNTVNWAGSAGLSTAGTDYINTVVGSFTLPASFSLNDKVTATIDPALINDWIAGNNYGLLLRARTEAGSNQGFHFYSSEHATEAYRPVLTVTYTPASQNLTLTCAAGSYSLTGTNADLTVTRHYTLTCEAGSYALTGTNADLTVRRNYTLVCASGSYSLTGSDISFVIQRNYTLACETGSYSLTGTDADLVLLRNYTLACSAGTYSLTGTNAGLTSARTMALESGLYTLTGTNVDFYRALVMACEAGSYALTGSDASLTSHRIFALGVGSYVLVGTSVGLFILSPTPACRTATIELENRTFAIPHENRTATIEFENRTLEVKCH